MKSIKEKAEEYPSGYMNLDRQQVAKQALEYGANYVLDIIEQCLTPQKCFVEHGIDICAEALVKTALQTIEQLKK